jgi:hypothetical protein
MRINLGVILLVTVILSGCTGAGSNGNNSNRTGNANTSGALDVLKPPKPDQAVDANFKSCNPYLPLVPGSLVKYTMSYSSGLIADVQVTVSSAEENGRKVFVEKTYLADRSGGLQINSLTEKKFTCDGERVLTLNEKAETRMPEGVSMLTNTYRDNTVMMPAPSDLNRAGFSWTQAFTQSFERPNQPPAKLDEPTIITFTVLGPEEITTQLGKFKAIRIGRKVKENEVTEYYVAGIGLVRRLSKEGSSWELKEYSGLQPVE